MSEDYLSHYGVLGMKWGVRKKTESSGLRKAAKAAVTAIKKADSVAKSGIKTASERHAANKVKRAKEAAERARKKLEKQKLREARKAEAERKKKQKEAKRAEKKRIADEKKAVKEAEKNRIPKGGISKALRKEAPHRMSSTDLIEQNKRLTLEKQNYELKEKLKEYESQNRSALAKTADLFVDEARKNLTKYAARTATDMLTAALDSKLKGTEYEGIAAMAKSSLNLDAILKNATGKK